MPRVALVPAGLDNKQPGVRLSRHCRKSAAGTGTIPVRLGRRNTIYLLLVLMAALAAVGGRLASAGLTAPSMPAVVASGSAGLLLALVHQVRDWYSGVAIKMGGRQGGPSRTGGRRKHI